MTSILSIRDSIIEFFRKYDRFTTPVFKFFGGLLLFWSLSQLYGYSSLCNKSFVILALAVLAAFVPSGLTMFLAGMVSVVHVASVSLEAALVYFVVFLAMYMLYVKFFPKTAPVIMYTPVLYMFHLHYMMPLLAAIFLGPIAIVPVGFGVILYYLSTYVKELSTLITTATEEDSVSAISFILLGLMKNKTVMLTIIIFAITLLVTYIIYKLSVQYAWYIAIAVGGITTMIVSLIGSFVLEVEVNMGILILGTIAGVLITLAIQFFKGLVDYSRTENVQFEDDDYYYYVKAVPKMTVSQKKVNVTKINERKEQTVGRVIEEEEI